MAEVTEITAPEDEGVQGLSQDGPSGCVRVVEVGRRVVEVWNRCDRRIRVRVVIDDGPDSRCVNLRRRRDGIVYGLRYSWERGRFRRVRFCDDDDD